MWWDRGHLRWFSYPRTRGSAGHRGEARRETSPFASMLPPASMRLTRWWPIGGLPPVVSAESASWWPFHENSGPHISSLPCVGMVASFKPCSWWLHVTEALTHPGGQSGWWGLEESRLGPAKCLEGLEGDCDILCPSLVPFRLRGAFRHGVTQSPQRAIGQMAQAVLFLFYSWGNGGSERVFDPKEWVRVEPLSFDYQFAFFYFIW